MDTVGRDLLHAVLTILPEPGENDGDKARDGLPAVGQEIAIGRSEVIQVVDHDALLSEGVDVGVMIDVRVRAGHFVLRGGAHVLVRGGTLDEEAQEMVRQAFVIGPERSPAQDIEFGIGNSSRSAFAPCRRGSTTRSPPLQRSTGWGRRSRRPSQEASLRSWCATPRVNRACSSADPIRKA